MSKLGIDYINDNPELLKKWIVREKETMKEYVAKNPNTLITKFEQELHNLGFEFEILNQALAFMPTHKDRILPIAIWYYKQARDELKDNEQNYFMSFFYHKGFDEVVPMLLQDFYSPKTTSLTRERISDTLWKIHSKKHVDDYLKILLNPEYEQWYLFITNLVSELKVEAAIPIFIKMLDNENTCILGVMALGKYKRPEFRPYFERFLTHEKKYYRKEAEKALKKIN